MGSRVGSKRSMSERDVDKKAEMPERSRKVGGGTAEDTATVRQSLTARGDKAEDEAPLLIEEVLRRENVLQAYKRVVANEGAPGVDGMTVDELMGYCREHWPRIRDEIRSGRYQPQPVLKVEIKKPEGGKRMLGIPTVLDRMIQQALLQVLTPLFDPTFSQWSFGFRPGRSARGAVSWSRIHMAAGYQWVVDLDLEKFFDRVNHDILMSRVARRVKDKQVLRLIRRYLQAGLMEGGVVSPRSEGTPQGGPLSPLLSNVLLDELDKELEKRGHRFCRYADDCNVYVKSQRAGERVMASLETFLWERLRLKVNRTKSAVARPWHRKFLGYSVTAHRKPPRLKVAPESLKRLKAKLRPILRRGRGKRLDRVIEELNPIIRGWVAYFRMSDVRVSFEVLDKWVRRKLRCVLWRQWKHPRTRRAKLMARGLSEKKASISAYNGHGPWWNAGASHMNQAIPTRYFRSLGLLSFLEEYRRLVSSS
jgi:RNA-directed DNA polymerase